MNNKSNKKEAQFLSVSNTLKTNSSLIKTVQRKIELKYKYDGMALYFNEFLGLNLDVTKPDFAFIGDYYVHRKIPNKHKINSNKEMAAKVINQQR